MKHLPIILLAALAVASDKPTEAPKPVPPTEAIRLANLDAARNRAAAIYFRKIEENRQRLAEAQRQLDEEAKRVQIDAEKAERDYLTAVDAAKEAAGAKHCTLEENSKWAKCGEAKPK